MKAKNIISERRLLFRNTQEPLSAEESDAILKRHLERYYVPRRGAIKRITVCDNLLGQPHFREVHFANDTFITFCKCIDGRQWFRHFGGGRYGPKYHYEGRIEGGDVLFFG
jgi:hypothetical protein